MGPLHIGQDSNCAEQLKQKPLCLQGRTSMQALESKHKVQASSFTVCFFSISSIMCLQLISLIDSKVLIGVQNPIWSAEQSEAYIHIRQN